MDDPHDDDRVVVRKIVDGVRAMERHAKAGRKLIAAWAGERKMSQRLESLF